MADYVISWRNRGPGIIQRTYSYRTRVPRGSVRAVKLQLGREEELETSNTLDSRRQLYSDLYAETNSGSTYNYGDIGHDFISQTWRFQPYESVGIFPGVSHPEDASLTLRPNTPGTVAFWPLHQWAYDPTWADNSFGKCRDALASSINNTLWAQCPDRISGSLGQDVVDVVAFGKSLDKLLTLRSQGESLYRQFSRFSAKKRHAIDDVVRLLKKDPRMGRRLIRQRLSGGYLTWLFQYLPWVEDVQTLIEAATSTYLRVTGRTRKRTIVNLEKALTPWLESPDGGFELWLATPQTFQDVQVGKLYPWRGIRSTSDLVRNEDSAACHMTCSIVSVWTQNFEHGAVEPLYELNKKLGIIYPSLVWDLIPWTWLIDWFINIGKFIDRAYMRAYGEWNCAYAFATVKYAAMWRGMTYESTARWHVHPGLWDRSLGPRDLNSSQWKILAALGLSHRN